MNYNLVQREVRALGEDLTELAETIKDDQRELAEADDPEAIPSPPVPVILATITCIFQRLSALLNYVQGEVT